ncbi:MAG TPA: signal peptidase I [Actinomycetes bacterium]|nr:signal peptidase I [Actinomycetes bacterium]
MLETALLAYLIATLGLALLAHLAPVTGHALFAVRTRSMAPALAVGDLVVTERVADADVRAGDVIAFRLESGTVVTHRVISVTTGTVGRSFTTKGDANGNPDPVAISGASVEGRAMGSVPLLGFLLALLSTASGITALFSIGAALLTAIWVLDEGADDHDEELVMALRRLEAETAIASRPTLPTSAATR